MFYVVLQKTDEVNCDLLMNVDHIHMVYLVARTHEGFIVLHQNKVPSLDPLMCILVSSNFLIEKFSQWKSRGCSCSYIDLPTSLKDHPLSQAPFALTLFEPVMTHD